MIFKIGKKSILTIFAIIAPFVAISCGKDLDKHDPTPIRKATVAELEEADVFFYDALFNSNYFQQLVLNKDNTSVTQEEIINFAKKHPQIKNFDERTQTKINQDLNKIELKVIDQMPTISLKIKNVTFEHQLKDLKNQDAYTFNNQVVSVDINKLDSFEDIFNVFSDIWNIKAKYNQFIDTPFSKIYDYEFENSSKDNKYFSYLENKARINNLIANIYAWNFDYQINFVDDQNNFDQFHINSLTEEYKNLTKLMDLYNDKNYMVNELSSGIYELRTGADKNYDKKPNFAAYPIVDFASSIEKWNPLVNAETLPENSYVFYEKIISLIFNDFYQFSQSNIFTSRVKQNFDKSVKIYEYDEEEKTVKQQIYLNINYNNAPTDINAETVDNKDSRSYLEYMLAQWLYNSKTIVEDFETITLSKKELDNLQVKLEKSEIPGQEFGSKQIIYRVENEPIINEKWTIPQKEFFAFTNEDLQDSKTQLDTWIPSTLNIKPKYGYNFSWENGKNNGIMQFALYTSYENNTLSFQSKYIENLFLTTNIVEIDDTKLRQNWETIFVNENTVLDWIDVKINDLHLKKLIEQNSEILNITSSHDTITSQDGLINGNLVINFDLTNSDSYFNNITSPQQQFEFKQKLKITMELLFIRSFERPDPEDLDNIVIYWRASIENSSTEITN